MASLDDFHDPTGRDVPKTEARLQIVSFPRFFCGYCNYYVVYISCVVRLNTVSSFSHRFNSSSSSSSSATSIRKTDSSAEASNDFRVLGELPKPSNVNRLVRGTSAQSLANISKALGLLRPINQQAPLLEDREDRKNDPELSDTPQHSGSPVIGSEIVDAGMDPVHAPVHF